MFGTIRKHSTWLWVVIIIGISISMVWFFTPEGAIPAGGGAPVGDFGTINGRPITQPEYLDAHNEVRLAQFLYSGKWPGNDEASTRRLESETISRVFLIQKLKEMGMKSSDKAVALMVHEQLRDYPYESLEREILQPNGLKIADYDRFVRNESALRQLIATASVSSRLVTAADAEPLWRKENQEVATQLAVFWTSNYLDKVVITNGAIGSFYTNRINFYRLPERMTLSYVEFSATNYLAEADKKLTSLTNLNDIVSDYYFRGRGGTNSWTDTNGLPLPEAAAKEKIKDEIRHNEALMAARRAATDFGNQLISHTEPNSTATFESLSASSKFAVKLTAPFDRMTGLEEFDDEQLLPSRSDDEDTSSLRDVIRERAFALTDERPVQFSPIPGRDAIYLIAKKGKVPSELQPLSKITDKVTADYKAFMAFDMARKEGTAFQTNLTNGLALNKTFGEICAAEKVKTIEISPFAASSRNLTNVDARINLRMLQGVANDLEIGSASQFLPAQPQNEGGFIIYVKGRPSIDENKMKTELPAFVGQMRTYRQNEAFQQWFRKQVEQSKVAGPQRETSINAQQ